MINILINSDDKESFREVKEEEYNLLFDLKDQSINNILDIDLILIDYCSPYLDFLDKIKKIKKVILINKRRKYHGHNYSYCSCCYYPDYSYQKHSGGTAGKSLCYRASRRLFHHMDRGSPLQDPLH